MRNLQQKWIFSDLQNIPADFQSEIGGFSVVSQTLFKRGITTIPKAKSFLDPSYYNPSPPSELPGIEEASNRISKAIKNQENILVWGDFDVDGQTSTTLLKSALVELGGQVYHYIPNRALESHGITIPSLSNLINLYKPTLIITCDTGIDAYTQIEYANENGVDVIITDHHQLPKKMPEALAIINPAILASDHPLANLPGVGVAYKLIENLFEEANLDPTKYLDLVALGIVADVAVLTKDTRYLLQLGLAQLKNSPRPGLLSLYSKNNLKPSEINEEQIGFVIAPRLNALGRLSDANSCVDFFTSSDSSLVNELGEELESLNSKRQALTDLILNDALEQIQLNPELVQDYPILVLLGPPSWNPGVIGIVASRLVERFQRPVIMLTEDGDNARGSARSIPGVGISDLIDMSSSLLHSHGGHPMAAGLTLALENVSVFRRSLSDNYLSIYGESLPSFEVAIDSELPFNSFSVDFIADFNRLAPFGSGNPKLLFAARSVRTIKDQVIGQKGNHRKVKLADSSGDKHDFLWWNSVGIRLPKNPFDIAFSLDVNTFRSEIQVQATLRHFRESPKSAVYLNKTHKINYIDHRKQRNPLKKLKEIYTNDPVSLIWAEYKHPNNVSSFSREELSKTQTLIIWTVPANRTILKNVLDLTSPQNLHIFADDPGIFTKQEFLEALLGLLKHLEITGKKYDPGLFAQRIAQPPALIEAGLDWLHCHGDYDLTFFRKSNKLDKGSGRPLDCFSEVDDKLTKMLIEVRSFRKYFMTADLHSIL
jgi:single-stranded-DNA-specific exonuclease